jgi:hypothetical protein
VASTAFYCKKLIYFEHFSPVAFACLGVPVIHTTGLQENYISTDRKNRRGNNRARVTSGSRNPKHGKKKHYIVHKYSRLN